MKTLYKVIHIKKYTIILVKWIYKSSKNFLENFNKLYKDVFYFHLLNIEELISLLPSSVTQDGDIIIPDHVWKRFFQFLNLNKNDVLVHFNCGKNNAIKIAIRK